MVQLCAAVRNMVAREAQREVHGQPRVAQDDKLAGILPQKGASILQELKDRIMTGAAHRWAALAANSGRMDARGTRKRAETDIVGDIAAILCRLGSIVLLMKVQCSKR